MINLIDHIKLPFRKDKELYSSLYRILGFYPHHIALYRQALAHSSSAIRSKNGKKINNERLEFLGDAVLGLVTASRLYSSMPDHPEGDLAKIKSAAVSEASLSEIAGSLDVSAVLVLGRGEELSGGRNKKAILADAMEAVIGALYLDSGFKAAETFVRKFMDPRIASLSRKENRGDFKSLLQEYVQKRYKTTPVYTLEGRSGPDHAQVFSVSVNVHGTVFGPASGKNKKEAEQAAAEQACQAMGIG